MNHITHLATSCLEELRAILSVKFFTNKYTYELSSPVQRRYLPAFAIRAVLIGLLMLPVTLAQGQDCSPVSTLECTDIPVSIPYSVDFSTEPSIGVGDTLGFNTGFTMVLDHSEARRAGDLAISNTDVNGYEPDLLKLNTTDGRLEIKSQAGIAYLAPPSSSNNNNQVNTLGVGLTGVTSKYVVKGTFSNVNTGGSSAQVGIWLGTTEDDFVKLVAVNNSALELRVEGGGASTTNVQTNGLFSAGNDVHLEMLIDPIGLTVTAFYSVNGGDLTQFGSQPLPANYFTGRTGVTNLAANTLFAGVFATHRNGSQFTANVDDFGIENAPNLDPVIADQSFTIAGDASSGQVVGNVVASDTDGSVASYSIVGGSTVFAVDNSGQLTLIGDPVNSSYVLPVEVTDNESATANADVTVNVNAVAADLTTFDGIQINFQDNLSTSPPANYLVDFGEEYGIRSDASQGGGTYTYGWIDIVNGNPVSLVGQGRNRSGASPLEQLTTIHMEHPSTPPSGFWEFALPNGDYDVTVSVGDESVGGDPTTHRVNAEGINIIDNFDPTAGPKFATGTQTVTVSDGKLTLDYLGGGQNTKLNYVSIQPFVAPNDPPAFAQESFDFTIPLASVEDDVVGIAAATDPEAQPLGYELTGTGAENFDVDANGEITVAATATLSETTYILTLTATDDQLQTDQATVNITVEAPPVIISVNFQDQGSTPPAGFLVDYGKAFGTAQTAEGGDYGWKQLSDNSPIDVSNEATDNSNGSGRNRLGTNYAAATDQEKLEGTLMHMQGNHIGGWGTTAPRSNEVYWEVALPNGTYQVEVSAGDYSPGGDAEVHTLNVEGVTFISTNLPSGPNSFDNMIQNTRIVEVSDNALTINAFGGINTKINYVIITETSDAAPAVETLTFNPTPLPVSLAAGETGSGDSELTASNGTPTIGMIIDPEDEATWLSLPGTPATGTNTFGADASALATGNYSGTVVASAVGFAPQVLEVNLEVTDLPPVTAPFAMNVGDAGAFTTGDNVEFTAEGYVVEYNATASSVSSKAFDVLNSTDDDLFLTYRFGPDFGYDIPIANGDYDIDLYFLEPFFGAPGGNGSTTGARIFDVLAEDITFLDDYDLNANGALGGNGIVERIRVNVADGVLSLRLTASENNAIISAIRILPPNDPPAFAQESFDFTIPLASVEDDVVGTAAATDPEAQPLGYELTGTGAEIFDVDANGEITVAAAATLSETTYILTLTATDDQLQTDQVAVNITVEGPPLVISVNFQDQGSTPPAGFLVDYGKAFGTAQTAEGGDYGWKQLSDNSPIDVSNEATDNSNGSGRNRLGTNYAAATDQEKLEGTLMHMQGNHIGGWGTTAPRTNEVYWEVALPNGTYQVEVSAGDYSPGGDAEVHTLNVEGVTFISTNLPSGPNSFDNMIQNTRIVEVSDNALTINAFGGINTKINYVIITETSDAAPAVETLTFNPTPLPVSLAAGETGSGDSELTASSGTPTIGMIIDPDDEATWLSLPGTPATGTNSFGADASVLATGNYSGTVVASAVGYAPQALDVNLEVTAPVDICSPISLLECSDIPVSLPYALDFSASSGIGLEDKDGLLTGFTMVLEHSQPRRAGDEPISEPAVNGYEMDLLTLNTASGNLEILSQAGIAYLDNSGSSNTNNQVNTLGVGLTNITNNYFVRTSLVGLTTGTGAAQAGLWLGIDEDNFVKLNAANNGQIEMRVESGALSNSATQQLLASSAWSAGDDIQLEMLINPTDQTVTASYAVNGNSFVELGVLDLPSDYFTGRVGITDLAPGTLFAGIYATHRNGSQFTASFDEFSVVEDLPDPVLAFDAETLEFSAIVGETITPQIINLSSSDGSTPVILFTEDPDASEWLPLPDETAVGPIEIEIAADVPVGNYQTTLFALSDGYTSGEISITLDIFEGPCSPVSLLPCSDVAVALPYNQDFSAPAVGMPDLSDNPIGFTMALEPSARLAADDPVLYANVPGYEPGLITLAPGNITLTSTKGIFFSQPAGTPTSTETNSQINALGVGVESPTGVFSITTELVQPDFASSAGNSSQQGGLWFGLDEDHYIKLALIKVNGTTQKLQLQVENLTNPTASSRIIEINQASMPIVADQLIGLRLELDPENLQVHGYYSINGGSEIQVEDTNSELAVPPAFFAGMDHDADAGTDPLSFGGIFTTQRRAAADQTVDVTFNEFNIEAASTAPALAFAPASLDFSIEEGGTPTPQNVNLTANTGSPTIALQSTESWVVLPAEALGSLEFGINTTGLTAGDYSATVTASASGYADAELVINLEVTPLGTIAVQVNFSDQGTPVPAGYLKDFGQSYGDRGNGFSYGWVSTTDGTTPLSLEGNGRNRTPNPDANTVSETLMHMQYNDTGGSNGVAVEGIWEIELPNGTYEVTIAAGDVSNESQTGTSHQITAEGVKIINLVAVIGSQNLVENTGLVVVNDGKLTLDPTDGGFNTKIRSVSVVSSSGSLVPRIVGVIPTNNAINVALDASISANDLFIPNEVGGVFGVDNATINSSTVKLFKVSDNSLVPSTVNGTGGGDAINLTPSIFLEPNTTYRFEVDGVTDLSGAAFEFFSSVFTTGSGGSSGGGDLDAVSFTKSGNVATGAKYTTVTIGPDDKLYGLTIGGEVHRWTIEGDGSLSGKQVITTLTSVYGARTAVGMEFDPDATSTNLIVYISHNTGGLSGGAEYDGKISRLTGDNLQNEDLVVTRLPRSIRDHLTNSIAFRPGEPNVLYFNQGSNSAGGAPDNSWGNRPERLLSAAVLRLDLDKLPENQWPLDAETTMNAAAINSVNVNSPTLDGKYNPYYIDAPLTLYATGVRNAYDLVWHSNGQLYVPTNGTASGSNSPASIDDTRRPDGTFYDHDDVSGDYPVIPAVNGNNTQKDWLFRIDPGSPLGYYGHPNPLRGEFVLNRGAVDVTNYAAGVQPDVNYRGAAFDFEFNKSPNGVIEYKSEAENGNLAGVLLVARYSGGSDIIALVPDGTNGDIGTSKTGIPGFTGFDDPLDLVEDVTNGNIYVSDYGASTIVLLTPNNQATASPVITLSPEEVFTDDVSGGAAGEERTVFVSNTGNAELTNIQVQISGTNADQFQLDLTDLLTTIPAGSSSSFKVIFDPSVVGPVDASIQVSGDNVSAKFVGLNGLGKTGIGGSNEPSLQYILDTYNFAVNAGDQNPATNVFDLQGGETYNDLLGDEVDIQQFERASDGPVTLQVLGVYGPEANNPIVGFGWYESGNPGATTELFTVENSVSGNGQTLNPVVNGVLEFDPGLVSFGFYNRWPFFSNRFLFSEDALNTFSGAIPHHVRVYELPGESDAYIIATEEHISGFDYQDIVVIARNVRPASSEPPVASAVRLNAGGTSPYIDGNTNTWSLDGAVVTGSSEISSKAFDVLGTDEDDLFLEYRFAQNNTGAPGEPFGYEIPIDGLDGPYTVKLYFLEPFFGVGTNTGGAGDRVFSVDIEGGQGTLSNFDIAAQVSSETLLVETFSGIEVLDGNLTISFTSETNNAIISAIEVIGGDGTSLCPPISTLACSDIQVSLPFALEFDGTEGGLSNTGFTMVDPPSARLTDPTTGDGTISNTEVPGYEPGRIDVSGGTLTLDAAKGIAYRTNGGGADQSTDTNSQINTLGVAIDAAAGAFNVETVIINPYSDGDNDSEQAGIWFGIDEDNFVKFVAANNDQIELRAESGGLSGNAATDRIQVSVPNLDASVVTLRLNVDPVNLVVEGFYALDGGSETSIGTLPIPAGYINGASIDGQDVSFAGLFGTKRREDAAATVLHEFESFSITPDGPTEGQAFFTSVNPPNNATNVSVDNFQITVSVVTPEGYELDETTLSNNVKLFELTPGGEVEVPSNSNDTGGGDAITLSPAGTSLKPFTSYIFRIDGVEANLIGDVNDRLTFETFESRFTTGQGDNTPPVDLTGVSFTKVEGGSLGEGLTDRFTSLAIGPDGKLYGSTTGEDIKRWTIQPDGTLSDLEVLTPNLTGSNHPVTGVPASDDRLVIGFAFDPNSTADNLIAYVSHSALTLSDGPEWDGKISKLSGPNLATVEDLIIHLPRSKKDHLTNSIVFGGPDNDMFIVQGSNSAGGEPDAAWGFRPERLLAAAVLQVELDKMPASLPLSVFTTDDISVINSAPSNSILMSDNTYNPYSPLSPLTLFSTGVRNAYDAVWHSNGFLYIPTNGTAGNNSTSPNTPASADYAPVRRPDGTLFTDLTIPGVDGGETQKDWLFRAFKGSYHGHPNPYRGEFVLNHGGIEYSGLPGQTGTDVDVDKYPDDLGPDPAYVEPAFDFGFNKSPNGALEYKSNAFGGKMKGLLLVVRFSGQDDIIVLQPGEVSGSIVQSFDNIPGFEGFDDPLEIVEDPSTGNIYLAQYDRGGDTNQQLILLRADDQATPVSQIVAAPEELIFETTVNTDGDQTEVKTVSISNDGTATLEITDVALTGAFASQFDFTGPTSVTLNPGESQDYDVTYQPVLNGSDLGYQPANLSFTSNADGASVFDYGLHALKKAGYEGGEEPPLQDVVNTLGIGINVGWTSLANGTDPAPVGEEVSVPLFIKAGSGPVEVLPVGRYSPAEELPFGWYTNLSNVVTTNQVGILANGIDEAQTLYPSIASGSSTFDPQGNFFGFYVESEAFNRINYTEDALNTGGVAHRARIYPVKDRDGNVEPNKYLVTFEDANNGDYNDYMFVLSNVKPYEEGSLLLTFTPNNLVINGNPEGITTGNATLTANAGLTANQVELVASDDWIIIPSTPEIGSPMSFGVNGAQLGLGTFEGTVTASAPGYAPAIITITANIQEQVNFATKINFQDDSFDPPSDYVADVGLAYGNRGNGLTFGWIDPDSKAPLSNLASARGDERGVTNASSDEDKVLLTLNMFDRINQDQARDWEIEVPNGTYLVEVAAGDPQFFDSQHTIRAEGVTLVSNFVPSAQNYFQVGSGEVEVSDGKLTLDDVGAGTTGNTKIIYVLIAPVGPIAQEPLIAAEFTGLESSPNLYRGTVDVDLSVEDQSGSGIARFEFSTDGGTTFTPYTETLTFGIGTYELIVEADDNDENTASKTYNFSVEEASGAILAFENMTKIPGTDRSFPANDYFTFHRLDNLGPAKVQDRNNIQISNTGVNDLIITNVNTGDVAEFIIENTDGSDITYPIVIAPGETNEYTLVMVATTGTGQNGIFKQMLSFSSNADNGAEATLHGGFSPQPEGGDEIDAQEVIDVFGFQTSMLSIVNNNGTITPPNNSPKNPSSNYPLAENVDAGYEGDLILSSNFVQADPNQPVRGIQLSALHGGPSTATAKLIEVNSTAEVAGFTMTHQSNWYQTLLPRNVPGEINNDFANSINVPFRIQVANENTAGKQGQTLLGVRVLKVFDQNGDLVPNEYIVIQDYIGQNGCGAGSANCDWNDNTFYFINIRPQAVPTAEDIPAAEAIVNTFFQFDFMQYFDKGYPGNELTYTFDGLPDWLVNNEGSLDGAVPPNSEPSYNVQITATDLNGLTAVGNLSINVTGTVPQLLAAIPEELIFDGTQNTQQLVIEHIGEANSQDVEITMIEIEGTDSDSFEFDDAGLQSILAQGESTSLSVTLTNLNASLLNATLLVHNDYSVDPLMVPLERFVSLPPVADAGDNISTRASSVTGLASVMLNASNSTDPNEDIESYSWKIDGEEIATGESPTVELAVGDYTIELTVTDASGNTATDQLDVEVLQPLDIISALRINAGGPEVTAFGETFIADQYAGGNFRSYDNPFVTDILGTTEDDIYFTETTTKSDLSSFSYDIPVADGNYRVLLHFAEIYIGAPIRNGNTGTGERIFSVTAEGQSYPELTNINLFETVGSMTATVVEIEVEVTDGELNLSFDASANRPKVSAIEVLGLSDEVIPNSPPVANAGDDIVVFASAETGTATVDLDGTNSTDPDNNIVSYSWKIDSQEVATGETAQIQLPVGLYTAELTVTDSEGEFSTDLVDIEVQLLVSNSPPVANAGDDISVSASADTGLGTVNLDGSGSTDPDANIVSYSWKLDGQEVATGQTAQIQLPEGLYTVELTVTDTDGEFSTDNVDVEVTAPSSVVSALRINAGGPEVVAFGETFIADQYAGGTFKSYSNPFVTDILGTTEDDIYFTETTATKNLGSFTYDIPVTDGRYRVILHFAEIYIGAPIRNGNTGSGERIFSVTVEGQSSPDLTNINLFESVGSMTATTVEVEVDVADGVLNLAFDPSADRPKISAIEVLGLSDEDIPNRPPVADAGDDISVVASAETGLATVDLDGSGSTDPDDNIVSYSWKINSTEVATGETAQIELAEGLYTVELTVTDADGEFATDEVDVVVSAAQVNQPPVADAGDDISVNASVGTGLATVDLDGSGSTDPDNNIVSYSWKINSIEVATGETAQIELAEGLFTVELTVTDADGEFSTDEVDVEVLPAMVNQPPVADAGDDISVTASADTGLASVTLDGSGSTDPDNNIVSYSWKINSIEVATGETAQIDLAEGLYTVELTVTDGDGEFSTDEVDVEVLPPSDIVSAIRINAGGPEITAFGETFIADQFASGTFKAYTNPFVPDILGTTEDGLYLTETTSTKDLGAFSYNIPVANGRYRVVLHFAEIYIGAPIRNGNTGSGERIFSVSVEGQSSPDLTNINLVEQVGSMTATTVEVEVDVNDGLLDLAFDASVNRAKISAIEVLGLGDGEPIENRPPVADAGDNISASASAGTGQASIALDGSGSSDPDNNIVSYSWKINSIEVATGETAQIQLAEGLYTVELTVTDAEGLFATDEVDVEVLPPSDVISAIRINAGGPEVNAFGETFIADQFASGTFKAYSNPFVPDILGTTEDDLYFTETTSTKDLGTFSYDIPVSNGRYRVILHLAEIYIGAPIRNGNTGSGERIFSVSAEGQSSPELTNINLVETVGSMTATTIEVEVDVVDGVLNLDFDASVNRPKVSAIEVLGLAPTIPGSSNDTGDLGDVEAGLLSFEAKAFPNPFRESTMIRISSPEIIDAHILVYNMSGRIVLEESREIIQGTTEQMINLDGEANGVYLVRIVDEKGDIRGSVRIMKK